jgi:hypothetical protein
MTADDRALCDDLRELHRPEQLRLLLVGESPPDPRSGARRFFYAPALGPDNLYRGVAMALYGEEAGFDAKRKLSYLGRMRTDGVWLIDAVEDPVNALSASQRRRAIRSAVPGLIERCLELAPSVGVMICHTVVYDAVASPLREAGVRVLHDRALPFPLGNTRAAFVGGARSALSSVGWTVTKI